MIDHQEAREIVNREINKPNGAWPDMPEMIILDEYTVEKDYGWVFYWTSRPWRETGDFKHALAGNGPIIVSRSDGSLYHCGTAPPIEDRIREQELRLRAEASAQQE
ncbi:MAG TPA: YrhB domain-containing protein [Pyrinomonadaceae bacterium]|nr:YrhB domain-containing protein [Pyrinomonadaceae bacterium]